MALVCYFYRANSSFKKEAKCQEQTGITFPGIFGISPIGAIRKNFRSMDELANAYRRWIKDAVLTGDRRREGTWTESIAVGSESFVNATKEKLGIKAQGREVIEADGSYALR